MHGKGYPMLATFECSACGEEQLEELPELHEAWPKCCGLDTNLMWVLDWVPCWEQVAREGGIQTSLPKETRQPFPGSADPTPLSG